MSIEWLPAGWCSPSTRLNPVYDMVAAHPGGTSPSLVERRRFAPLSQVQGGCENPISTSTDFVCPVSQVNEMGVVSNSRGDI